MMVYISVFEMPIEVFIETTESNNYFSIAEIQLMTYLLALSLKKLTVLLQLTFICSFDENEKLLSFFHVVYSVVMICMLVLVNNL